MGKTLAAIFHTRTAWLGAVLVAVAVAVALGALVHLYQVAFEQRRTSLLQAVDQATTFAEAVARFDKAFSSYPEGKAEGSLKQIREGFASSLAGTWEAVIGIRQGDDIVFLHRQRAAIPDAPATIPWRSHQAEPMRRALKGGRGTVVAPDYRGEEVLAAFAPLPTLGAGLVIKVDLADVRAPFVRAGILLTAVTLAIAGLGVTAFYALISPLVMRIFESERRFRDLYDNMSEGVAIYRAVDDGRDFVFVGFNRAGEEIEGLKAGDLIGHRLTEVFPGVEEYGLLEVLRRVWRTGRPEFFEAAFYKDETRSGWRENRVFRLPSDEVVAIYDDVTEQVASKAALARSEERLELALEGANDGLWDWDVVRNTVYYSPRWKGMLGYEDHEIGNDFEEWRSRVHPDDIGAAEKNIERFIAGKIPTFEQEFRMRHKDGSWVHILARGHGVRDQEGKLVRLVGTHVDLTPLKRAQEALKLEKKRVEQYLDIAGNLFVALDPDGTILVANRATHRILGVPKGELIGKNWFDAAIPKDRRDDIRAIHRKVTSGEIEDVRHVEGEVLTRTGEHRTIAWHNRFLRDDAGEIVASLSSGEDVTDRKRAEASLRNLETIVAHSPAVAFLWRAANGWPVEYVSDSVRRFGYTPEDFTSGRVPFADVIHPDDLERVGEEVERYTAEGREKFTQEYRLRTKDGEMRWVDDRTWVRRDETGTPTHYQGVVLDITERKRVERALATVSACNLAVVHAGSEMDLLERISRILVEQGGYALAWIGFKSDDPGKTVVPAVVAGEDRDYLDEIEISWSGDLPIGQGPTGTAIRSGRPAVVHNTGADPTYAPWREAAARRGFRSSIALPLLVDGEVIGSLSIYAREVDAYDREETKLLTDLAADLSFGIKSLRTAARRLEVERELGVSAHQLKTITDRNLDALVIVDREGKVRFANPAADTLFGRPLLQDGSSDLGIPVYAMDWQRIDILRPGSSPAIAEFRAVPIPWQDEECQLLVLRDVTQQVEMEKTLDHVEKMEVLGALAGGIVHDIKNMLFPIISLSEMNLKALPEGSRERNRAEKVVEAAYRVRDLVVGLLAFSRRSDDEPVKEDVSLHAVARGALELLRGTLPVTIKVVPDLDEDAGYVRVDASRLADAILNLATNAADAMEGRIGELRIVSERVELDDDHLPNVVAVPPGPYVRLGISDTGCGMDEKTLANIFEPFFTTKEEGKGTGLGLSLVLDFVRQHEAGLAVHSVPGEGSSFEFYFRPTNGDAGS